ncbi:DNA topoisomerase [Klebsiella phage fENko-Kae01]|nr:DNA topoisomerase [Klebsiella phage fENko-Kae01]
MAKSTKKQSSNAIENATLTLLKYNSSDYINQSSLEYAVSTLDRGIPGIDGLKSSQRKAIFTLSKISGEIKTVSAAGRMISDGIYLHGDASASGTLQNLASPVANNYPLIGKRGGFGTQVNTTPASARYTYVKRTAVTEALVLRDMDIVPMQENYDGTTMEPTHFLPIIPLSLFGNDSMSVGYKSLILPYKIEEIIDNCIRVINKKELKEMTPCFTYLGASDVVGKLDENKYEFYGRAEVIDASTVKILGLPPRVKIEAFIEKLIAMQDSGEIRDYDNDSTDTIDITIKLPRGTCAKWTEKDVIKYFGLSSKLTQSLVVLGENGLVKVYSSTSDLIRDFVNFRFKYYVKRYENLLAKAEAEVRYKALVAKCFENEMVTKIKDFQNRQELVEFVTSLNDDIGATDENIQNIVNYASYRWTQENYDKTLEEIQAALALMSQYQELLDDKEQIWQIYASELRELRKMDCTPKAEKD